jgi:5'(3')-deoxyribonucleotidase
MRIGIDMDDVLADFQSEFVGLLNRMYGRPPLNTAPVDWNWSNCEVSAEEMKAAWAEAAQVNNLWKNLKPLSNFTEETQSLLRAVCNKHDVFFVTNRFDTPGLTSQEQTKVWLRNNADIAMPNVLLAKEKGPMATVLQLDRFVDDRPKNCVDVVEALPTCKVYLADSSHNKEFNDPRTPRVADLKAFLIGVLQQKL